MIGGAVVYNLWWQRNIIRHDSSLQGEEKLLALASVELKAKVKTLLSICNFSFFLFVILQLLFCFPFLSVQLKAKVREKCYSLSDSLGSDIRCFGLIVGCWHAGV